MKKRLTLDARGYPSVEVKNRDGIYERIVDQSAIRRLDRGSLGLGDTTKARHLVPGTDPYGQTAGAPPKKLKQRSSLDYLRALSEEIKKKRALGDD